MAMKDYAKKKRRKVGRRAEYDKYDDSDRGYSRVLKANRSGRKSFLSSSMFVMISAIGVVFFVVALSLGDFKNLARDLFESTNVNNDKTAKIEKKHKNNLERELLAEKKVPQFEFYHTLPKMVVSDKNFHEPVKEPIKLATNEAKEIKETQESKQAIVNLGDTKIAGVMPLPDSKPQSSQLAKSTTGAKSSNGYFLQVASFKNLKDAEALKAKLTLSGFDVIIHTVLLPSGEKWHRVKSNKLNNIELAMNLHSQLKVHQIDSIILSDNT